MAAPLLAVPMLGKALALLKGGKVLAAGANAAKYAAGIPGATKQLALNLGGGAAKSAAAQAGKAAATQGGKQGLMRMAGDKLTDVGRFFVNNAGDTKTEVALRLAPDLAFGTLAGVMTPGDLGDKVIAGTTQAAGGALGGIGMAGLAKKMGASPGIATLADMGGSIAGDMIGMNAADTLMRAKGGGLTPYERMALEQEEMMRRQMAAEMYGGDPFLATNGLA